jgi:hypothetical protein
MNEEEFDIREVLDTSTGGDRLEESASEIITTAASIVSAATGVGMWMQAQRVGDRDREHERALAAQAAMYEQLRREQDYEYRLLRAQFYGLDALDAADAYEDYFGVPGDGPFRGFGPEY